MDHAELYMGGLLDRLGGGAVDVVSADVLRGEVLETLKHELHKRDVTCIVMTTHARSGVRSALMGGVATRLVHESRIPVLLCGPLLESPGPTAGTAAMPDVEIGNIVVALDGSPAAEAVLPHAIGLAGNFATRVTLLAVTPGSESAYDDTGMPASASRETSMRGAELSAYLVGTIERLARPGLQLSRELIRSNDVAAAITRFAADAGADLIAMTTHGRGPAARVLLGSVSAAVVESARLPVLLYRPAFPA